jgi:hypothetical protein
MVSPQTVNFKTNLDNSRYVPRIEPIDAYLRIYFQSRWQKQRAS